LQAQSIAFASKSYKGDEQRLST